MIPRTLVERAEIPGGGELRLMRRGEEFAIMLGASELMGSRSTGSEEAVAHEACRRIASRPRPTVLIGGLGMGFTLRAALSALPRGARVTVAELVPAVIAWARGPLAPLFGGSLDDRRVTLLAADVADSIAARAGAWDAILLDVDNGPDGLTLAANDRLYTLAGLARARAALRPGGILGLWSSAPDKAFTQRLRKAGFAVDEIASRAGGRRHHLWFGTKTA